MFFNDLRLNGRLVCVCVLNKILINILRRKVFYCFVSLCDHRIIKNLLAGTLKTTLIDR